MRLLAVVGALGLVLLVDGCHRRTLKLDAGSDATIGETGTDAGPPSDAESPSIDAAAEAPVVDAAIESAPRACAATCATPGGPLVTFATEDEVLAEIRGRWLFCSGQETWFKFGAPKDVIGIEYAADRAVTYLVAGPTGPVRGVGAAYQLTSTATILPGRSAQLNMYRDLNYGFSGSLRYVRCPRALLLSPFGYDPGGTMLVALEDQTGPLPMVSPEDLMSTTRPVDPACAATCGTAGAGIIGISSVFDAAAAAEGRWRICSDLERWRPLGAPGNVVGIEIARSSVRSAEEPRIVDGNLYFLVDGPDGPVRGTGFAYRSTYSVEQTAPSAFELTFHVPSGDIVGVFGRTPCPSTLELFGNLPHASLVQF